VAQASSAGAGVSKHLMAVLGVLTIVLSLYIHDPMFLNQYTDYVAIFARDPAMILKGYPYVDYHFEYTPIIALLWLAASKLALLSSAHGYGGLEPLVRGLFAANTLFYIIYVVAIYRIARATGASKISTYLAISSPSMAYYLFYNWDIVASSLMAAGLAFLLKGRLWVSSIALGLASSVKVFPGLALIASAISISRVGLRRSAAYLALGLVTASIPYLTLLLAYPPGFFYIIGYHSTWYCENCFYILVTDDIFNQHLRMLSTFLMVVTPIAYALYIIRVAPKDGQAGLVAPSLASVSLSISLSYVYSPQMNLMISPLYLLLRGRTLYLLLLQDLLNTVIMILWFHESALSELLGIQSRGPWHRESPIQWISFSRIAILWAIAALIARNARLRG